MIGRVESWIFFKTTGDEWFTTLKSSKKFGNHTNTADELLKEILTEASYCSFEGR